MSGAGSKKDVVIEIRGLVKNNVEPVFQVSIKLGFRLEGQPVT